MSEPLSFEGFIKNVSYKANLTEPLTEYDIEDFDINATKTAGVVRDGDAVAGFSKWVSPKRTRSYPFERIYRSYNHSKVITVIPIIKDEGKDGDLDRIQYSTFSWMNLLNVYIVLGFYNHASKNNSLLQKFRQKITRQKLNQQSVKEQMKEILGYKQSALHWNRSLFEDRFSEIFVRSLSSYQAIANETGVSIHSQDSLRAYLAEITSDFEAFRRISLKASQGAVERELKTTHRLEHLVDGAKAKFYLTNYLGGVYYLTADEVIEQNGQYVIQESKNTTHGFLPSLSDIRDGLFKLILYANLDSLKLNQKSIHFTTQLKLTGTKISGQISLPATKSQLAAFESRNSWASHGKPKWTIDALHQETLLNKNLQVLIQGNHV